jgi:hypothetical protein
MTPEELAIGRRVRIVSWSERDFIASFLERTRASGTPVGVVVYVERFPRGEVDIWVRVEGFEREYCFGPEDLELLPEGPSGGDRGPPPVA